MSQSAPFSSSNYEFKITDDDDEHKLLNQFSSVAWGHPEVFLKKATSPEAGVIEFIDLGEYFTAVRLLFAGVLDQPTMLVRDEYHIALDTLQGAQYRRGAFVIGQPGIGKQTTRPVAWHTLELEPISFH